MFAGHVTAVIVALVMLAYGRVVFYACILNQRLGLERVSKKWIKTHRQNVGYRIIGIKRNRPLKPRIEEAQQNLLSQISKLDSTLLKMEQKDQVVLSHGGFTKSRYRMRQSIIWRAYS